MYTKLFVTLFFRQKRFLLLFLFLVAVSSYFIVKQVDGMIKNPQEVEIPDIELLGNLQEETTKPEIGYQEMEELVSELKKIGDENTEIYSMAARNLDIFSSPFYQVSFELYGVEEEFFHRFKNQLAFGAVPLKGEDELLIGNNAAVFYQLNVGDNISKRIDFFNTAEAKKYIISGILKENESYFGNGLYILHENFQELVPIYTEHKILIYVSGKQVYKKITNYINQKIEENEIKGYIDNYKGKLKKKNQPARKLMLTFIESILLLELVYLYMCKGLDKKVGIVKALGIPDGRVLTICGLFFGGLILLATAIVFLLSLILFDIQQKALFFLLLATSIATFLILFFEVAVKYKRISPRESMPAK